MKNIYEVQSANKIKTFVVVAFFLVFSFAAIYILTAAFGVYMGYEPGGLGYFGTALIFSGISTFISYWYSDRIVLGISGARKANSKEDKLFWQVAENLCIGAGLPRPKLYVIPDTAPNAFATGRDSEHAVICATTGLLSKLNRTELEGVLAHEISHIKNYDIRLMSVVSVMVGLIALLGDWFLRMGFRSRGNSDESKNTGGVILILGVIFAVLSPIIAQLIQLAISRRREFMADAGSVEITRQPQGLISALQKISADTEPLEAANKATAHLYIVSPFRAHNPERSRRVDWFSGMFNTHPPMTERIKTLKSMA